MSNILKDFSLLHTSGDYLITPSINPIFQEALPVARSSDSVLIVGALGSGKEVLARFIHDNSPRKDKPFIPINCPAIPEPLFESEMCGYEKGAHSMARESYKGKLALAEGGTLFLDEIGKLSLLNQSKFLQIISSLTYYSLGGNKEKKVNCWLILATNQDLEKLVTENQFLEDLYFRISVVSFLIRSLRDRGITEVLRFLKFFNERESGKREMNLRIFDKPSLKYILNHPFQGNVRELENLVKALYSFDFEQVTPDKVIRCITKLSFKRKKTVNWEDAPSLNDEEIRKSLYSYVYFNKANKELKIAGEILDVDPRTIKKVLDLP